jgi:hypothetical protein
MKKFQIVLLLIIISNTGLFAQQTREYDGNTYTVIEPEMFEFNADSGKFKVGERYVIDDSVSVVSGNRLYLKEINKYAFILSEPLKHEFGTITLVTVYLEITENKYLPKVIKVIRRN